MKRMKRYDPLREGFLRQGRHAENEAACALWWSGDGVVTALACTRFDVEAEAFYRDQASFLGVLVDGAPVARVPLRRGRHRYSLLLGMDGETAHEITVLRDTQPSYDEEGPVLLHAVYTDGIPQTPARRPFMLEFLGDSLTVGEGTLGPQNAQEWRMPFISHLHAFPTLTAAGLTAEKRVIALGGWGVYKSYDGKHASRIGAIYERLCAVTPGGDRPYSFHERPADAVIINLGTNDGGAFRGMDAATLEDEKEGLRQDVAELLRMVRAHQPQAYLLWAYGLCGEEMAPLLREGIDRYQRETGDSRVGFLLLPDAGGDVGSRSHPSRRAHARAASCLIDALKKALAVG